MGCGQVHGHGQGACRVPTASPTPHLISPQERGRRPHAPRLAAEAHSLTRHLKDPCARQARAYGDAEGTAATSRPHRAQVPWRTRTAPTAQDRRWDLCCEEGKLAAVMAVVRAASQGGI